MFPLEMKNRFRHIKLKNKEKTFAKAIDEYNNYFCDLYEIKDDEFLIISLKGFLHYEENFSAKNKFFTDLLIIN